MQGGGNQRLELRGLDGAKQSVDVGLAQSRCVHQQDHVGRRARAFCLEPGQYTGVVRVHPVDADACGFGEVGVKRFVGLVVTCRIQVEGLFLGCGQAGQTQHTDGRQAR